jgi:diguanylate cyclase (GGDEF)-like protein/PAS domain S-box-containing protein
MNAKPDIHATELRRQAEEAVARMARTQLASGDQEKTMHELLVHQVELEMQNEELRRLQAVLDAERTRYFDLFDLAPVGYVALDEANAILEANLTAATLLGLPREKLSHLPLTRVIEPADQDAFYLARKQLVATEKPQTCELRMKKSDGTNFWARLEITKALEEKGKEFCRASISDISAAVTVRASLARREEEYRLLAENASDVVFRCAKDGIIEWISPSVFHITGWTPEDLVGHHFRDFVHPDDTDRLRSAQQALLSGTSFEVELRVRISGDGYHWFSVVMRPALGQSGSVTHFVGGWRDVQREVQTRNELEAERARLHATLDSLLDPHVVLEAVRDRTGKITDFLVTEANEAACHYNKLERADFVGRRLLELLPAHTSTGLLELYRQAVESDHPLVLNEFPYPHEIHAEERRFDIRAVRVGDALSYTWRDVTERSRLTRKIAQSEEKYRLLAKNSSDVIIRVKNGNIEWISPSVTDVLGWSIAEQAGKPVAALFDLGIDEDRKANLELLATGAPVTTRSLVTAKDGTKHWMDIRTTEYLDAEGKADGLVAACRIVDEEVAAKMELERRARTDELTNLLNRKAVFDHISEFSTKHPRTGHAMAVLFCDLDKFKNVNDTYGHAAGDEVLRVMADRVRACLRSTDDLGARVGGDELLVVLHGVQDLDNAVAIAEKLRLSAAEPIPIPGGTVLATVSIGVTLARPSEPTSALVARADEAMYRAKATGRNHVVPMPLPEK